MLITIRHSGHTETGEQFTVHWQTQSYPPVTLRGPEAAPVEGYDDLNLRDGLVWYLEEYLERPYGPNTKKAEAVEKALHRWGEDALEQLFSGKALRCLDAAQEDLKSVQIRVVSNSPAVLSWPWEALRDERGSFLFLHSSMERQPENIQVLNRLEPGDGERLNILLVISRPREGDINYHFLSRDLVELVSEGDRPIQVDVLRPPSFDNLRRTLEARPGHYHIVHFDGHGGYDPEAPGGAEGRLFFEKEQEGRVEADPVSAEDLGQLFRECRVPMMVLNACQSAMIDGQAGDLYSSVAASLLRAQVRSVVAMGYSLFTGGAKAFINAFYEELLRSGRPEPAMREGRIAMYRHKSRDYPLSDWIVPQLYQQAQQNERVLPDLRGRTRPETPSRLPPEARLEREGFIGRGRAIQELERLTQQSKQAGILIHGMMGQGKTTLVRGFLRWLEQTGGLGEATDPCPVLWLDFRQLHSAEAVIHTMARAFLEEDTALRPLEERMDRLAAHMKKHRKLAVWDNFESASGMQGLTEPQLAREDMDLLAQLLERLRGGSSKVLITSRGREEQFSPRVCARLSRPLDGLEGSELWALCVSLAAEQGVTVSREDEALSRLLGKLAGNPLTARATLLRLGEGVGTAQLLADFDTAFAGAAGDESTRRVRASFRLLCGSIPPEDAPVLAALSLFEQYADLNTLGNTLLRWKEGEPEARMPEAWITSIDRCVRRLCQAGFCQRVSKGVYQLHPSLRGCLRESFPPAKGLERSFVWALCAAENRVHNRAQERRGFAACHEANCRRAAALALEAGLREEYLRLIFALSVFADDGGFHSEQERLLLRTAEQAERWEDREALRWAWGSLSALYAILGEKEQARLYIEKATALGEGQEQTAEDYYNLSVQAFQVGDYDRAAENLEQAAALWEKRGDQRRFGVYGQLLVLCVRRGDGDGAEKWRRRLEDSMESCSDEGLKANIYADLAAAAEKAGELPRALELYKRSYEICRRLGDPRGEAQAGNWIGRLLLRLGPPEAAKPWLDRALALFRDLKHRPGMARSYYNLSLWALAAGEAPQYAADCAREVLRLYRELRDENGIAKAQKLLDVILDEAKD